MTTSESAAKTDHGFLLHAEKVGKLVSIASATLLILSVSYDYNFLLALGLSFDEVPTTLADHVRSAVVWAPKFALIVFAFTAYEFTMRRTENGMSEEEIINKSRNPKFMRGFRAGPKYLFGFITVIMILTEIFLTTAFDWLYFVLILMWGTLSLSVVQHPRLGQSFATQGRRFFIAVPIIVIYVGLLGYTSGNQLLARPKPRWNLDIKSGEKVSQKNLIGLRVFSEMAITVDLLKHVSLISTGSILAIRKIDSDGASRPLACRMFRIACPVPFSQPRLMQRQK